MTEEEIINEYIKGTGVTTSDVLSGITFSHMCFVKFINEYGIKDDFNAFLNTLIEEKTELEAVYTTINMSTDLSFELARVINEKKEEK